MIKYYNVKNIGKQMKNIFIIGIIVLAMGYMVSILVDKYKVAIEQQNNQKAIEQK